MFQFIRKKNNLRSILNYYLKFNIKQKLKMMSLPKNNQRNFNKNKLSINLNNNNNRYQLLKNKKHLSKNKLKSRKLRRNYENSAN